MLTLLPRRSSGCAAALGPTTTSLAAVRADHVVAEEVDVLVLAVQATRPARVGEDEKVARAVVRAERSTSRREALQTLLLHDGRAACELSRKQHDHACRRAPPVGCDERAVLDHARDETGRRILCWPVLSACQSPLPWLVPRLPPVRRQCARVVEKDAEVASVCGKPSAQRRELRWVRDVFEELQQRKRRRPTHLFLFRRFALCPARKSASDSAARL